MKKYLVILTILLLTFKFGKSQTNVYHPFPDSNAVWIGYSWHNEGGSGPCIVTDDYNLYISGDTTIGIYSYHKLCQNGFVSAFPCPGAGSYYNGQCGWKLFRQDITNKKIYLFVNGTDYLAYDFNLSIGDSLSSTCLSACNDNHIQSIDSVLVGSQYRKRFWISGCGTLNYASLIEGIGSTLGAFAMIATPFESGDDLWCLRLNNQIVWTSSPGSNCGLTSINEHTANSNKILISPNPFSSETTLNSIHTLKNATIYIYNSLGQQVKEMENTSGQTITLHRDNLPSGLYFIRLTQGNQTITTDKLLIID